MTDRAYAKLNLTLDIKGKREDGYHELSTVMREISLFDSVEMKISKNRTERGSVLLRLGKVRNLPTDDHNTCVKATKLFFEYTDTKDTDVDIYLEKKIPVGAGMGGGSSDAAAVLRMLNRLTGINLNDGELEKIALGVGADVPFFIRGGTQTAEGVGEKLIPFTMDGKEIYVVAKPASFVSTPEIYAGFDLLESVPEPTTALFADDIIHGRDPYDHIGNMLMPVTLSKVPETGVILSCFENLEVKACMSGSGPTVFGVFNKYFKAQKAVSKLYETGVVQYVKICLPVVKR